MAAAIQTSLPVALSGWPAKRDERRDRRCSRRMAGTARQRHQAPRQPEVIWGQHQRSIRARAEAEPQAKCERQQGAPHQGGSTSSDPPVWRLGKSICWARVTVFIIAGM